MTPSEPKRSLKPDTSGGQMKGYWVVDNYEVKISDATTL